jgi:hypothetical protein
MKFNGHFVEYGHQGRRDSISLLNQARIKCGIGEVHGVDWSNPHGRDDKVSRLPLLHTLRMLSSIVPSVSKRTPLLSSKL